MENTLVIKLDDYMKLVEEKEKARLMCVELNNKIQTQEETIKNLHRFIMENNLISYYFGVYELEELIDFNGSHFSVDRRPELLKLGISKEEITEFIKERYEEYKKGQEKWVK